LLRLFEEREASEGSKGRAKSIVEGKTEVGDVEDSGSVSNVLRSEAAELSTVAELSLEGDLDISADKIFSSEAPLPLGWVFSLIGTAESINIVDADDVVGDTTVKLANILGLTPDVEGLGRNAFTGDSLEESNTVNFIAGSVSGFASSGEEFNVDGSLTEESESEDELGSGVGIDSVENSVGEA